MRDSGLHWGEGSVLEPGRLSWDPIIELQQLWLYCVYLEGHYWLTLAFVCIELLKVFPEHTITKYAVFFTTYMCV